MAIEIRPFNENENEKTSPVKSDSRAAAFMESLRARVNHEDEVRQQKWDQVAARAAGKRKTAAASPEWLVQDSTAKDETQPAKAVRSRAQAGSRKRKGA